VHQGAGDDIGSGSVTTGPGLRFPTRRDVGLAVGAGLVAAGTLAVPAPDARAAGVVTAGRHSTVVVGVRDPAAPTGTRPARISYLKRADLETATVPVVYLLHGYPGSAGDFEHAGATTALFAAATAMGLRLVVVCPTGASLRGGDPRTDTEWGDDVQGQWRLETWMHTELLTAVEGTAVRAVGDRVLAGFSMGGFGAAMIGMRHPARYGSIAAVSGYFHLDDPDGVFGTDPENRVLHRPDHLIFPGHHQRYFLADSSGDTLALTRDETPRFAGLLAARGFTPSVHRVPGGHSLAVVTTLMPMLASWIAVR
jgi:predicted esterase